MQATIKLSTPETKILDKLIDEFLSEQNILGRDVEVSAVTKSSNGNYNIEVCDTK